MSAKFLARILPLVRVALIPALLAIVIGCDSQQSWELESCITVDSFERYSGLLDSVQNEKYPEFEEIPKEIIVLYHERRRLTAERQAAAIESGHLPRKPYHQDYYAEFTAAVTSRSMPFEFYRYGPGGGAEDGYFRGHGPGKRLHKTGILRGFQVYDGVRYQLVMYNQYGQLAEHEFEKITMILSHPRLLELIGCSPSTD